MNLSTRLQSMSFLSSDAGASGRRRSEVFGFSAFALAGLAAAALVGLPLEAPPSARLATPTGPETGALSTFLDAAPFDPLRRAESSVGLLEASATLSPDQESFVIGGILINGDERKVMFADAPERWRTEGELINGWLIRHIEPEQAILTRDAEIRTPTYRAALETAGQTSAILTPAAAVDASVDTVRQTTLPNERPPS
jgi:hypothetical protein